MTGIGVEIGVQAARSRALAVLRVRSRALAVALLPAALAVILLAGLPTGHLLGPGWDVARWVVGAVAVVVLLAAAGVGLVVARARPAVTPTVPIAEESAPDLYRLVRDLADRLDVPAPSAIALTPDCDSWLEDRTHPAHGPPPREDQDEPDGLRGLSPARSRRAPAAPVLVIGSPFLWWMRVGELRAVLAPVVAGTGPSAHPDIAAARRFVRGLDAAVAVASASGRRPLTGAVCAAVAWVARLLLRGCCADAAAMERAVAAAAAERAQAVDYGLRIVAQEQVGLAYAGWDRLLTRVALPAWRMGRWPSRLDAGVVAALTELSRRDRLAEGFTSRLGERPACDLLEEPGAVDEATSLLAARLFHGGPAEQGPHWSPVDWQEYPEEVVDRKWRTDAARLHRVLDTLGVRRSPGRAAPDPHGPTLARVLDHLSAPPSPPERPPSAPAQPPAPVQPPSTPVHADDIPTAAPAAPRPDHGEDNSPAEPQDLPRKLPQDLSPERGRTEPGDLPPQDDGDDDDLAGLGNERCAALAAGLSAELAREEAAAPPAPTPPAAGSGQAPGALPWDEGALPLLPLQPPRTGRDLLAEHVTAMVCCAAMDTIGAAPALDWLDGPALLINGERAADLAPRVRALVEDGDPVPLRTWLVDSGIRPEKPVRLV
ncbi:hypothetical protein [Streptomyces mexicanus]|uniref:hypothetical protein n=1 Tax=Streptomyces mexicanus TaxID=178566 RepID=UPI0036BF1808